MTQSRVSNMSKVMNNTLYIKKTEIPSPNYEPFVNISIFTTSNFQDRCLYEKYMDISIAFLCNLHPAFFLFGK